MIVALIDNGSLEPAAFCNLRAVAVALSKRTGITVNAVSWKHSDRIPLLRACTLNKFVRHHFTRGERDFLFVPFFISAQGAIGSALRADLQELQGELGGFAFAFTDGLAARGALAEIVAERIRETVRAHGLHTPHVVMVDHGGPSAESAALRDRVADEVRTLLGASIGSLVAASMGGAHPPLLADQLRKPGFGGRDVVVAVLFLSPGRHAGTHGDIAQICRASHARCLLTAPIGSHPAVIDVLSSALNDKFAGRQHAAIPAEAGHYVS